MANQLRTNPIVIDTAGASILHLGWLHIATLQWDGYTAGEADQLQIQDGRTMSNGSGPTTLFSWTGTADAQPISVQPGQNIKICDIVVPVLTSGRLTIWLE